MDKVEKTELSGHSVISHRHEEDPPFYGIPIFRHREHALIERILKKYKGEAVTDELQGKIWHDLQMEKHQGNITIPFKVVMRRDSSGNFPDYIEVILDTKV
jgi:hypothetical protein